MAHLSVRGSLPILLLLALSACSESHSGDGDTGRSDAGVADAPLPPDCACDPDVFLPPPDAGLPPSCDPQDAHAEVCPDAICDGLDSWAWDGERCTGIACGTCVGEDCDALPFSREACEAAHVTCEPALCRDTGGEWLFHVEECEHWRCGNPQPVTCIVGRPVCNCGDGRAFFADEGCVDIDGCPAVEALPPDELCESTGGNWAPGICCHTECGTHCDLDCAAPGCECGPLETFDGARGCVDSVECHTRTVDQTCTTGNDQLRCEDGLICCQNCGGAGCSPDAHCRVPVCDADPTHDECGNDLLAP